MFQSFIVVVVVCLRWINCFDIGNEAKEPLFRMVADGYDPSKPNITVPFMAIYGGFYFPMGDQCEFSTQLALDRIAQRQVLKNYNLIIDMFDEQCDAALGVRMSVELMERAKTSYKDMPPLLIGPGCFDLLTVGHFVKHYNFISAVEHVPHTSMFQGSTMYSNAFSFSASLTSLYRGVPHFIKANRWNRVFLFSDSMPVWFQVSNPMLFHNQCLNLSLHSSKVP